MRGKNLGQGRVRTRETQDGSTIVFKSRETVIMIDNKTNYREIFHRWFVRDNFYFTNNWGPFLEALRRRKNLTKRDVYELALKYEIQHVFSALPQQEEMEDNK